MLFLLALKWKFQKQPTLYFNGFFSKKHKFFHVFLRELGLTSSIVVKFEILFCNINSVALKGGLYDEIFLSQVVKFFFW